MDRFEAMRVFVEAAECQSFVAASRKLNLTPPAVTRSIAQLENRLDVRLFNRTTRSVRLTEAGARFFDDAKRILEDLEQAETGATGTKTEPKGVLSVTAPVLFGQKYVAPILTEYLQQNPAVEVKATFNDHLGNILDEGLDVAIRIGHPKDSSLFATRVGSIQHIVCGSPDYLDRHGTPDCPGDLANHEIILASAIEPTTTWKFVSPDGNGKIAVKVSPRLRCNQNGLAIEAAKSGFGITRLISYQVGEEFQNGSLIRILRDYEAAPLPISIIHLEGRQASAKIRSFIDLAVARLRDNPLINH